MGGSIDCCTDGGNKSEQKLYNLHKKQLLDKKKKHNRENGKVVIVGAGPAGIHMYSLLIKAGWNNDNITILEKTNRTAGTYFVIFIINKLCKL